MALPLETRRLYTAEEFMALPLDPGKRYALVRGEIKEMSHPGGEHTLICSRLMTALILFAQPRGLGSVLPPGGFKLNVDPKRDTVRAPDLAFMTNAKLAQLGKGVITTAPDLAVEVYSPNDEPGELKKKLEDYQQAGWELVWVIYPPGTTPKRKAGTVEVYHLQEETGLQPAQVFGPTETLKGENELEGFTLPVQNLFS